MAKRVFYDEDARRRVLAGAKILYDAVKTTLGPKGRNVLIGKTYGTQTVTKDGVTVARSIDIKDVDDETLGYKVGAELIKQASSKLNDKAGDGTTTVTVLTYHILEEANKLIAAGFDPIQLRNGLDLMAKEVVKYIDKLKENVSELDKLTQVATISASDSKIGTVVAKVIHEIGKDGAVTVTEGQGLELESEIVKGYTFDRGYVSPYMVTDQSRLEAVYDNPSILITDKKINSFQELIPILESLTKINKKDIVIIAEDVEGEALASLVLNKIKGILNVVAIKAPSFGDRKKDILHDIAIVTGATVISEDTGISLKDTELSHIGFASKVIVTKDETTIVKGRGSEETINDRVNELKTQLESSKSDYDKENLQKRIASIEGKVAVIKVGGATETEIEEQKFRVDDAVAAVKASLEEGVVAGGGSTLVHIANKLEPKVVGAGEQLLINALVQPFRTLLSNSGLNPDRWLDEVAKAPYGHGINVMDGNMVDLRANGVIDPAKVTKQAVLSSVSIAGTAMTMGALVVDIPEEQPQQPLM